MFELDSAYFTQHFWHLYRGGGKRVEVWVDRFPLHYTARGRGNYKTQIRIHYIIFVV